MKTFMLVLVEKPEEWSAPGNVLGHAIVQGQDLESAAKKFPKRWLKRGGTRSILYIRIRSSMASQSIKPASLALERRDERFLYQRETARSGA